MKAKRWLYAIGFAGLAVGVNYVTAFAQSQTPQTFVVPFSTPNRGGTLLATTGASTVTNLGYGRIRPDAGSTAPAGVAIFSFHSGQYLASETSVPATASLRSGRIYAEVNLPLNTGLAIANPNDQTA